MNAPELPAQAPVRPAVSSSFGKVLAGILIGLAPIPLALLILFSRYSGEFQLWLYKHTPFDSLSVSFAVGVLCSLVGGMLVGSGATQRTGARVIISIAAALAFLGPILLCSGILLGIAGCVAHFFGSGGK